MITGLTRDELHIYRFQGKMVPGVTGVLDGTLRTFAGISREALEKKRELGDLVHHATALDAVDDLDESTVDGEVLPYLTAFRRFRFEVKPQILSSEEFVYHPVYDYAGCLDHRMIINGVESIVDKKTGEPDDVDAVQLAGYAAAKYHDDRKRLASIRRYVLALKPDGTYRLRPYADYLHVFLAALTCYRFKRQGAI